MLLKYQLPKILFWRRWLKVNVADLRKGDWIEIEAGKPATVQSIASSFSGRGSRSFLVSRRMVIKDPKTDSITTIKPTGRDYYEKLELRDETCKFMYSSGDGTVNVLDEKTLDEYHVPVAYVSAAALSLLENGMQVKVRLAQDKPVGIILPRLVRCTVAKVLDNTSGIDKKIWAVLTEGGARIVCTVSLDVGDVISVDSDDLTFQGRVLLK